MHPLQRIVPFLACKVPNFHDFCIFFWLESMGPENFHIFSQYYLMDLTRFFLSKKFKFALHFDFDFWMTCSILNDYNRKLRRIIFLFCTSLLRFFYLFFWLEEITRLMMQKQGNNIKNWFLPLKASKAKKCLEIVHLYFDLHRAVSLFFKNVIGIGASKNLLTDLIFLPIWFTN